MQKNLIPIILFTLAFVSFSCGKDRNCHNRISFVNKSNKDVYVIKNTSGYPDTNYYRYDPSPTLSQNVYKVNSHKASTSSLQYSACYEAIMKPPESDTVMIYVFDAHVLETTPWDTVKAKNLYLKRYDLSLQDLQQSNWSITYP